MIHNKDKNISDERYVYSLYDFAPLNNRATKFVVDWCSFATKKMTPVNFNILGTSQKITDFKILESIFGAASGFLEPFLKMLEFAQVVMSIVEALKTLDVEKIIELAQQLAEVVAYFILLTTGASIIATVKSVAESFIVLGEEILEEIDYLLNGLATVEANAKAINELDISEYAKEEALKTMGCVVEDFKENARSSFAFFEITGTIISLLNSISKMLGIEFNIDNVLEFDDDIVENWSAVREKISTVIDTIRSLLDKLPV